MLDGLLGRGFSVKCKSLMKATRTRIDVVRRRVEAKQRFLKEDLSKLLANGLDINAYGRTEEFIAGMNLLSSYDFVEQSCEYIGKQLSRMQKQGECPEECREAVASLMFAAAGFSDLPELRDLRDTFQQRYGNGLEAFVNQKFVERLSSRPPAAEKRFQVLQDIALEFSIKWDSRGFQRRMATPPVVAQAEVNKTDMVKQRGLPDEKIKVPSYGDVNMGRRDKADSYPMAGKKDRIDNREPPLSKREGSSSQGENGILFHGRHTLGKNVPSYPAEKGERETKVEKSSSSSSHKKMQGERETKVEKSSSSSSHKKMQGERETKVEKSSSSSSHKKMLDNGPTGYMQPSDGRRNQEESQLPPTYLKHTGKSEKAVCNQEESQLPPSYLKHAGKSEKVVPSYKHYSQDIVLKSVGNEDEDPSRLKSLPPPYVKPQGNTARAPYVKLNEDRHDKPFKYAGYGADKNIAPDSHYIGNAISGTSRSRFEPGHLEHENQFFPPSRVKSHSHEKDLDYEEENNIPLPKPRSRRKHRRSSARSDAVDIPEDAGAVSNRISSSTSRTDRPRRGLQTLIDDEHHRKDDEEMMIDKLLLHYSKKPSSYDKGKLRKKAPRPPSHHVITDDGGESSMKGSVDVNGGKFVLPPRSISLPPEQTASPEPLKVFNRAKSHQPDNQVRHVHPKLPDYDDLAARFAALRDV